MRRRSAYASRPHRRALEDHPLPVELLEHQKITLDEMTRFEAAYEATHGTKLERPRLNKDESGFLHQEDRSDPADRG